MSDKPLVERLQVKKGRSLAVVDAPPGLEALLAGQHPVSAPEAADVVLIFTPDRARFDAAATGIAPGLRPDVILWIAYPKLTSPLAVDLSRDIIHRAAPAHGLDTVAQIAVDADWSALRLKRV